MNQEFLMTEESPQTNTNIAAKPAAKSSRAGKEPELAACDVDLGSLESSLGAESATLARTIALVALDNVPFGNLFQAYCPTVEMLMVNAARFACPLLNSQLTYDVLVRALAGIGRNPNVWSSRCTPDGFFLIAACSLVYALSETSSMREKVESTLPMRTDLSFMELRGVLLERILPPEIAAEWLTDDLPVFVVERNALGALKAYLHARRAKQSKQADCCETKIPESTDK